MGNGQPSSSLAFLCWPAHLLRGRFGQRQGSDWLGHGEDPVQPHSPSRKQDWLGHGEDPVPPHSPTRKQAQAAGAPRASAAVASALTDE